MRKVVIFILLFNALFAGHIYWLGDYDKALAKSKLENKPLLLLVVNKDRNSTYVLKNIFSKKSIVKMVNNKTIPVIVLFESKNSYPIEMFYTTIFPTLFLINSKDERLICKPIYANDISELTVLNCLKSIKDY